MSMAINMPLGGLIDKSLKGEARFAHEEWLRTYVKRLTNGNKTKLKQALNEVDEAINQWRNGFFISTYDEKLSAVRQGKLNMDSQELEDVYNEVFNLESTESEKLLKDLGKKYALSRETFRKFPENDQEFLQNFSFICLLSYDVYIKKMIIESVIDNINSQNSKTNKKENSKKESSKKDTV